MLLNWFELTFPDFGHFHFGIKIRGEVFAFDTNNWRLTEIYPKNKKRIYLIFPIK